MADAALLRLPQEERLALTRQALDAGVSHFSVADHHTAKLLPVGTVGP